MGESGSGTSQGRCDDASGCAFIDGDPGGWRRCARPRQAGSPYCPRHHARCHIAAGSGAETSRLRAFETLAAAVGGRRAAAAADPPTRFLDRLERLVEDFS